MTERLQILVVDDDAVDRKSIKRTLAKSGLASDVIEAEDETQAHAALSSDEPPDCILLDYLLPGRDGLELIRELRASGNAAPIVAMTGHGDEQLAVALLQAGATEYVPKSALTPDLLASAIRNAIRIVDTESRRCAAEVALKQTNRHISNILESIAEPFFVVDWEGVLTYVNRSFARIVGDEVLGRRFSEVLPESTKELGARLRDVLESGVATQFEWQEMNSGRWFDSHLQPNSDGLSVYSRDVTQRKRIEADLQFQANHDKLTGLPNRGLLMDRLRQSISRTNRRGRYIGILFCDLDRFKNINDSMGHRVGDELLCAFTQRLLTAVRDGDTVARLSGDEFVIVLDDMARVDDIPEVADKLLRDLTRPYQLAGVSVPVTTSVGASVFPDHGRTPDELLCKADYAMYAAKNAGKSCFAMYRPGLQRPGGAKSDTEEALRKAIESDQFVLHYQPIVDMVSGKVRSLEALLRWNHPQRGQLQPNEFLAIAEDSGLILPIGDWVLEQACADMAELLRHGMPHLLHMAVNIAHQQMRDDKLCEKVRHLLAQHALAPTNLELEVTEHIVMGEQHDAVQQLRALHALGVRVALDDFGTGHSSLGKLKQLPLNSIKIDRSFVSGINNDRDDAAIAGAIIALSHEMRLTPVAEGVETKDQANWLKAKGCSLAQGYLYARPTELAALIPTLATVA